MNIKKEKLVFYIALGACVVISGFFLFKGVVPYVHSWITTKRQLSQRDMELTQRYQTAQENERLKKEIADIEKTYGDFNRMFFELSDISSMAREFAHITQDLQIEVISLVPSETKKMETLSAGAGFILWETPLSLKMRTTYAKLLDFIKRIEQSDKFIRIKNFNIRKDPDKVLIRDIDMTLCIYSLQKEEAKK